MFTIAQPRDEQLLAITGLIAADIVAKQRGSVQAKANPPDVRLSPRTWIAKA